LLQALVKSPSTVAVVLVLAVIFGCAILAPYLPLCAPQEQILADRLKPPLFRGEDGTLHLLGTDHMGRDLLSRIIFGARISLFISFAATGLGLVIGVTLGLIAGYFRGPLEHAIMRLIDAQMSFPFILIAVSVIAILGTSITNLILVLILSAWAPFARIVRGEVLLTRELTYIEAIRAVGASNLRIMLRHILPNILSAVIIVASLEVGRMILIESSLSFLGLGVPESVPSWGGMLSNSRKYIISAWWFSTLPGLAIVAVVTSVNLFGDFLRDYFDPKLRGVGIEKMGQA